MIFGIPKYFPIPKTTVFDTPKRFRERTRKKNALPYH